MIGTVALLSLLLSLVRPIEAVTRWILPKGSGATGGVSEMGIRQRAPGRSLKNPGSSVEEGAPVPVDQRIPEQEGGRGSQRQEHAERDHLPGLEADRAEDQRPG